MHSYNSKVRQQNARQRTAGAQLPATTVAGHNRRAPSKSSGSERGTNVMGGLQAKFPRPSTSSTSSHHAQDGQRSQSTSSESTDGPGHHHIHPSVARVIDSAEQALPLKQRRDFKSLDRSLKVFLRASNLPGLEYRLKLAGYHRLDDLLDTDAETLTSQGFTRLMAKRLMTSLDSYILRHLDITEGQPSPFQLVRRGHLGQKIKSDPSDEMKALPNYGKRNVKRHSSSDQPLFSRSGKKRSAQKQHHSPVVRLMSEEQMPSEPIFPNVIDVRDSVFVEEEGSASEESRRSSRTASSSSSTQMVEIGRVVEIRQTRSGREDGPEIIPVEPPRTSSMFEEFFLDDVDTPAPSAPPLEELDHTHQPKTKTEKKGLLHQQLSFTPVLGSAGLKLRPTASIPASFWFASVGSPSPQYPEHTYIRMRAYSCPPSLASMATPLEALLSVLTSAQDMDSIISALKQLVSRLQVWGEGDSVRVDGDSVRLVESGVIPALVDLLKVESTSQRVMELCCRALKLIAREGVLPGVTIPAGTSEAVLEAMNFHPTSERVQIEGCLALGNLGRTDTPQCKDIVKNEGLQTISLAMKNFSSSPKLQLVAMTALAVVLGAVKGARTLLLSDYGHVLDTVFQTMQFYPEEPQLQQYACALLALLVAEVGAQVESGVMQLIVEHVTVAMTTHSHDDHVTIWAAKVFANAAENAVFCDQKLVRHCAELLTEAIAEFPEKSSVVCWCSFALLQLASSGYGGVVSHVIRGSQLPAYCQNPPSWISDKAQGYLKQLLELQTT